MMLSGWVEVCIAGGIHRQDAGRRIGAGLLDLRQEAGAQRVLVVDPPASVALHAGRHILPRGLLGNAVEQQVADRVRREIAACWCG